MIYEGAVNGFFFQTVLIACAAASLIKTVASSQMNSPRLDYYLVLVLLSYLQIISLDR